MSRRQHPGCCLVPRSFATDHSGSTAIIFAVALTGILALVGAALDAARWNSARQAHGNAIDSGLLAGARHLQVNPGDNSGAQTLAVTMYNGNLAAGMKGTPVKNNTVKFATATDGISFTFTGNAYIATTFLKVVGISQLPIATPAKALSSKSGLNAGSNLEIALMLDVTGSMCDNGTGPCTSDTKIAGVKSAAADLANIVLGQTSTTVTSRMALVPFAAAIRIDENGTNNPLMQTLTGLPPTWSGYVANQTCSGWNGYQNGEMWVWTTAGTCTVASQGTPVGPFKLNPCLTERNFRSGIGFDPGDNAPGANNWLVGSEGSRFPISVDSGSTPIVTIANNGEGTGKTATDYTWQWNYSLNGDGCPIQPGNEILPLTSSLQTVTDRINTLTAAGPTAGALGVVWTQYMLSPRWATVWTGASAPGSYSDTQTRNAYGAPLLRKVAVLMTDGGFNTYLEQAAAANLQTVSDYALQVCSNMKSNGIEIYTVGFNLNALTPAEQSIATATLKSCGTDISHFYDSIDSASLASAFRDIALKIAPVRLSQ